MKAKQIFRTSFVFAMLFLFAQPVFSAERPAEQPRSTSTRIDIEQVPTWSNEDRNFFLHGSMSTEVIPEPVLRAFIKIYPDLFPTSDLSHLGLIADPEFGWPIGLSRKVEVKHLGGIPAVGINCASCHVAQITSTSRKEPIQILGV